MHNRDCFWKPFGSERVNESEKLLKFAENHFYPTFSSFWAKLNFNKFFLMRSEVLGLLAKTLTANYEYFRSNTKNLPWQIQGKLSEKPIYFCDIFFQFLKSTLNFQCSETNMSVIGQTFLELLTPKHVVL